MKDGLLAQKSKVLAISLNLHHYFFLNRPKGSRSGCVLLCDGGPLMTEAEAALHTFTGRVIKMDQRNPQHFLLNLCLLAVLVCSEETFHEDLRLPYSYNELLCLTNSHKYTD